MFIYLQKEILISDAFRHLSSSASTIILNTVAQSVQTRESEKETRKKKKEQETKTEC